MPRKELVTHAKRLASACQALRFSEPVSHVYNPLRYAWAVHEAYLRRYGDGRKRILFVGMNPGPFGMAQTGVPFGEIAAVRDWMKLSAPVDPPEREHPKRPVLGFDCPRSEVSGRRLWGAFADRFGTARAFFKDHFVANYCPLAFLEDSGRNRTPDKLPRDERTTLFTLCDAHLRGIARSLRSELVIGIGAFAAERCRQALDGCGVRIEQVLHPSPASPRANRGWAEAMTATMIEIEAWQPVPG